MKKVLFAMMMLLMVSLLGNAVMAQKKGGKARDLFIEKARDETKGKSGVKVRILLKRGSDRERYVDPDETFYSGDKIKLAFDINFSGHIAMINIGSSGKLSLLYPYDGVDSAVEESDDEQLFPAQDNAWITFDDQPGSEKISIIFSTNPIKDIQNVMEMSKGGISASIEASAQSILVKLNSRSLSRAKSRDLSIQTVDKEATYVVAEQGLISQPTGFIITLNHEGGGD
jgi:hypothetical protein